ncbi:hypothetical protein F0L68_15660 [Solihabitans fulvus]|uniref:Uncharacterized protein n=1 Tax=Solihabitans fulvus TaxID=1892852 RepID=A0A5B2XF55_9PSEU|nr:hypothetical protein [Solihabitans fulvus]KAA2261685.1 hypothetical protein F0L68_15660 [Solihabitans fulvus]
MLDIGGPNSALTGASLYIPAGPHFVYSDAPDLFLERRGRGPLFVAWDTNLLLDYFQFGSSLWRGDLSTDSIDEKYCAELEGLQLLLTLWVMRDIRFVILPQTISDAKKKLSAERKGNRITAFEEFVSALRLVGSGVPEDDAPTNDGLLSLPEKELQRVLMGVPAGYDRLLVEAAVRCGVYVFLNRDAKVLRNRDAFRPFGLLIGSPLDLLEELLGSGAFHCMLAPQYAQWPMMDQMRVGHLIRALPEFRPW